MAERSTQKTRLPHVEDRVLERWMLEIEQRITALEAAVTQLRTDVNSLLP